MSPSCTTRPRFPASASCYQLVRPARRATGRPGHRARPSGPDFSTIWRGHRPGGRPLDLADPSRPRPHRRDLFDLLDAAPHAKVVTTFLGVGIMSTERPLPMDRVYLLNPGQSLDVGDRTLTGFRPPLFDSPATVGFIDQKTGVCFSSDFFGGPLTSSDPRRAARTSPTVPADEVQRRAVAVGQRRQPLVHKVDQTTLRRRFDAARAFDPSWTFSVHLPAGPAARLDRCSTTCSARRCSTRSSGRTRPRSRRCWRFRAEPAPV